MIAHYFGEVAAKGWMPFSILHHSADKYEAKNTNHDGHHRAGALGSVYAGNIFSGHTKINDEFNQRYQSGDSERYQSGDSGPAKQQIQDPLPVFADIKLVSADRAQEKGYQCQGRFVCSLSLVKIFC